MSEKHWGVFVPRIWGWCRIDHCDFWSRREAEGWCANFGGVNARVFELRTRESGHGF